MAAVRATPPTGHFRYLSGHSGYNTHQRAALPLIKRVIRGLVTRSLIAFAH